ncbi:RagB/SusD family nutrient uptake outer membrane protein [Paraflavitalea sp. CAU 1676]|uniref:RagB/SusD family nutrient uptake outer membrane protein n=1 Tax=Paraflavitalea sp. CAU 1676 TaxID=3032598 RepID=UPI0023D98C0C|nr:RagB/SusD family nutrient uptake outer membrane protein [Paraflavitalea sp. CAU 1676]MDF2190369.1 RagB/SusD family nutrient uptake outer membrane protein [Paraflavitalea sp. CAU 1676]
MKKFIWVNAVLALSLASCKKDLLDKVPYDQLASENMWTTDNLTEVGVNGIYNALRLGYQSGGASGLEIYQYDRFSFSGQTRDAEGMMQGTITPGNGLFSGNWRNFYEGVIRANDAIANIPAKSPSSAARKARFIAESKFLRAYYYFRLNQVWKGVPIYLEPTPYDAFTKARSTEAEVWNVVLKDLTDAINEPELPSRYTSGSDNGRATRGAAFALRGKVYMYMKDWNKAAVDFDSVKKQGYTLFGNYTQLFKEANERAPEMIFSLQNIAVANLGSTTQFYCGGRSSFGFNWNTYLVSPNLVDLYEKADGSKFNWDDVLPGYSAMKPEARQVFFLRDNLSAAEKTAAAGRGADMSQYLPVGNEARIKAAYENRDPRLAANVITPYSTFNGVLGGTAINQTVISRFPYRSENSPTLDYRTDTQAFFYYLYRKFVGENNNELLDRSFGPIDQPLIRYADVLLMWAEALNEQGDVPGAIAKVNEVRARVNMPALQQADNTKGTFVAGQTEMTERIRNERRVEFPNEGINYFDELRWKSWKSSTFKTGSGVQQVWGQSTVPYTWGGDYLYTWAIPAAEIERNPALKQNDGWPQ